MLNSLLYIVGIICAVWVIYDVWANNTKKDTVVKVIWTVCAVLFSIITAIVYYLLEKK